MNEPECKCTYSANHNFDCEWLIWKKSGSPKIPEPTPDASGLCLLNISYIDTSDLIKWRVPKVDTSIQLKDSIRTHGIKLPISVCKLPNGKYKIIDGRQRFIAAKHLGFDTIPVQIVKIIE